jgi:prepilin-type N-terminal cleavage/methylation domain-containing protein
MLTLLIMENLMFRLHRCRRRPISTDSAFTMVELLVVSAIMLSLSAVGFNSMQSFSEERKLRNAGIELVGYLENARTMAQATNSPCVITLTNQSEGIFDPDSSAAVNSCKDEGSIISKLNLSRFSGSDNLNVQVQSGSGTLPYTFTPEGTTRNGITFLLTSSSLKSGGWCVNIEPPLATVRLGWRQNGSNACDYGIEQ